MAVQHGDVLRVTCNFLLAGGVQYQNVYHYLFDGVGIIADGDIVDALETQLDIAYDELQPMVKADVLNDLSSVDIIEFVTGQWTVTRNVGTFTLSMSGISASDALPYMSSPFVTLKTARPKSVGRKFLFPIGEVFQDATILVSEAVDNIVLYASFVLENITVAVVNALIPGIVRTGVDDYLVYTAAVVTNVIGSQKRRRPGVGA